MRWFLILVLALIVIRCGNDLQSSQGHRLFSDEPLKKIKDLAEVAPRGGQSCRVSDYLDLSDSRSGDSTHHLFLRGGGWEQEIAAFANAVGDGEIAIVLSANQGQGVQQFYAYYQKLLPQRRLRAIYTDSTQGANRAEWAGLIENAAGVIISGGRPERLKHLAGTKLAQSILKAFNNGVPVYGNSAALSMIGAHYIWNVSTMRQLDPGLSLFKGALLSHVEKPYSHGQYPQDLWVLIPKHVSQGFALTADTQAYVSDQAISVLKTGSNGVIYVFDNRMPQTAQCRLWYLVEGETLKLR